jgi:hypothetical protein
MTGPNLNGKYSICRVELQEDSECVNYITVRWGFDSEEQALTALDRVADEEAIPFAELAVWACPGFVDGRSVGNLGPTMQLHSHSPLTEKHSLVRPPAEPFFRPDPHSGAAAARSAGQGSPQATAEGGAKRP